jgi:hypothetical protein
VVVAGLAWIANLATETGASPLWLTVPLWIAAALAVLAVILPGAAPRWIDGWRLALVLLGLYFLPTVYGRLSGDGLEYYALLRSPVLDGDIDFANDYAGFGARPALTPSGDVTSRVAIGQALLWLPPFLVAHVGTSVASLLGANVKPDGFAIPYQAAATSATYLYGLIALLLLESRLRRLYGAPAALLATLALWLATPVHFYLVGNPFMSHGTSLFLATAFVLAWLRAREGDDWRAWAIAGLLGGLTALVRPQDAVLLALPAIDLLWLRVTPRQRLRLLLPLAAAPCILALTQLAVWLRLYGHAFAGTVAEQNWFGAQAPQWIELLFSPRHGLFTWTPLFLVGALGWIAWLRRDRRLALLFGLGFALAVAANAAMTDWWGCQAFGQRRLLSLVPLFALGIGEAIDFARRRPLVLVGIAVLGLILWNEQFLFIYNSERVAPRDRPITFDQLAAAQVDRTTELVIKSSSWLPTRLFVLAYDNLRGVWLDADPRSLNGLVDLGSDDAEIQRLVGDGWYGKIQIEGETSFRHTRGRRSFLSVPIKEPACFHLYLRARSEMGATPLVVTLFVNGVKAGEAPAQPAWSELEYDVSPDALRTGFNEISLVYSATPRDLRDERRGRDNALSVATLRFRRLPGPPCVPPEALSASPPPG